MTRNGPHPDSVFTAIEVDNFIKICSNSVEGLQANSTDKRKILIMQFSLRVLYNAKASMFLIGNNDNGTVSCLMRSTFEFLCRGLWLNCCATDHQLNIFLKKDFLTQQKEVGEEGKTREMKLGNLAKEIDEKLAENGFPVELHYLFEINKKDFNSLTHGGLALLNKTFDGRNVTNSFHRLDVLRQSYFQLLMAAYATTSLLSAFEKYDEAEHIVEAFNPINETLVDLIAPENQVLA